MTREPEPGAAWSRGGRREKLTGIEIPAYREPGCLFARSFREEAWMTQRFASPGDVRMQAGPQQAGDVEAGHPARADREGPGVEARVARLLGLLWQLRGLERRARLRHAREESPESALEHSLRSHQLHRVYLCYRRAIRELIDSEKE